MLIVLYWFIINQNNHNKSCFISNQKEYVLQVTLAKFSHHPVTHEHSWNEDRWACFFFIYDISTIKQHNFSTRKHFDLIRKDTKAKKWVRKLSRIKFRILFYRKCITYVNFTKIPFIGLYWFMIKLNVIPNKCFNGRP